MSDVQAAIRELFRESARVKEVFLAEQAAALARAVDLVAPALDQGCRLLLFGNGGSAADAQHIAAELVGRFMDERRPLPAIALTTDTSALTAISNDYGYDEVFARQVRALGRAGDVAIAISTSGRSPSVLRAVEAARALGMQTIGLTGGDGVALDRDRGPTCGRREERRAHERYGAVHLSFRVIGSPCPWTDRERPPAK